jgi:hypothetical protein
VASQFGFIEVYDVPVPSQLTTWSEDLNQYVRDEDDESFEFSVRLVAQHVLREISRMFGSRGQAAIGAASQRLMDQGNQLREAGSPHWWKCREAGLLGLGILAEDREDEDYHANLPAGKCCLMHARCSNNACLSVFDTTAESSGWLSVLILQSWWMRSGSWHSSC